VVLLASSSYDLQFTVEVSSSRSEVMVLNQENSLEGLNIPSVPGPAGEGLWGRDVWVSPLELLVLTRPGLHLRPSTQMVDML